MYDKEKEEDAPDFTELDQVCKLSGICRSEILGRGIINVVNTEEYYTCICDNLKTSPRFLTKGKK